MRYRRGSYFDRLRVAGFFAISLPCFSLADNTQVPPPPQTQPTPATSPPQLSPSTIGHIGFLDFKNGFRSFRFGEKLAPISDFALVSSKGDLEDFQKNNEETTIGIVHAKRIIYHTDKGTLFAVEVFLDGKDNVQLFLGILESAFGKGINPVTSAPATGSSGTHQTNEPNAYYWEGKVAKGTYSISNDGTVAQFWIGSIQLSSEAQGRLEKLMHQAAEQL